MAEVTTRYEQRTLRITHQLAKTLRRVYRNRWTKYTVITKKPIMGAFGQIASIAMYDALL